MDLDFWSTVSLVLSVTVLVGFALFVIIGCAAVARDEIRARKNRVRQRT